MNQNKFYLFIFLISFGVAGEIQYQHIFLSGLITNPKQEISGMDLYNDQIMLLPENLGGFLYMISKGEILNALEKKDKIPIEPKQPAFQEKSMLQVIVLLTFCMRKI